MSIKLTIFLVSLTLFGILYAEFEEQNVMKNVGLHKCLVKVRDNYFVEAWRKSCE